MHCANANEAMVLGARLANRGGRSASEGPFTEFKHVNQYRYRCAVARCAAVLTGDCDLCLVVRDCDCGNARPHCGCRDIRSSGVELAILFWPLESDERTRTRVPRRRQLPIVATDDDQFPGAGRGQARSRTLYSAGRAGSHRFNTSGSPDLVRCGRFAGVTVADVEMPTSHAICSIGPAVMTSLQQPCRPATSPVSRRIWPAPHSNDRRPTCRPSSAPGTASAYNAFYAAARH